MTWTGRLSARAEATSPLKLWFSVAIAIRAVSAATHSTWFNLDEWYQTIELGGILGRGVGTYSQEVELHLRNLSWPAILALGLRACELVSRESIGPRIFVVQSLAAATDIGLIWGFWRLSAARGMSRAWQHAGLALVVLPWMTVADSVRPSAEHVATSMAWLALGLLAAQAWLAAGVAIVAIAAAKYPAGIFSALFAAWGLMYGCGRARLLIGLGLGAVIFGAADGAVYGRPWESLWMYAQYNVFTGLGARLFGEQPASVYLEAWRPWFSGALLPWGLTLAPVALLGWARGLQRLETQGPWALGATTYLAAHLLIAHKEPRFAWPLQPFALWAALLGAHEVWPHVRAALAASRGLPRVADRLVGVALAISLVANLGLVARAAWGEELRIFETWFELPRHLAETPRACAIVTARPLTATLLPAEGAPPVAWFAAERRQSSHAQAAAATLYWHERAPACVPAAPILLHVDKPDAGWAAAGCELLPSGLLAWLPRARWDAAIARGLASGPWYRCPSGALALFGRQVVEQPFARAFARYAELPPLGIAPEALGPFVRQYTSAPKCHELCAAVDFTLTPPGAYQ